jgi:HAD superfamily hydrolase (TIGR01484 family)
MRSKVDDTLLDAGQLPEAAYAALFALERSGLRLIALTGRPASWGEIIARMWPVEAAIAENGAIAFRREGIKAICVDTAPASERKRRQTLLGALVRQAQKEVVDLVPSDDVGGRLTDYTFDIGEHHRASEATISAARRIAHEAGARTTRSSVHLHFTFDRADKASGALSYLLSRGQDPTRARRTFAFIGDSENDASAFAAFQCSVGVRNVHGHFSIPPRFVTPSARSTGFCEFASHLLSSRQP